MKINNAVISYDKNKLTIKFNGDEKVIKFKYDIGKVQEFENCIVVMIDPPQGAVFNENVFGVSYEGKILWQVKPLKYVYNDSPFTGMVREENFIKLFNWDGTDLTVNPRTGEIISKGYSK